MNSKRQTIWLVSMLSLMVVLSAYYLFTEDADKLNTAANTAATDEIVTDNQELGTEDGSASEDGHTDAEAAGDQSAVTGDSAETGAASGDEAVSGQAAGELSQEQILAEAEKNFQAENNYFAKSLEQRTTDFDEKVATLQAAIVDPESEPAAVTKAHNDLSLLESEGAKQKSIEDALVKEGFEQAVILRENGKWKVVVKADKLEKSEAVSIVDRVIGELDIEPGEVSVQYRLQ